MKIKNLILTALLISFFSAFACGEDTFTRQVKELEYQQVDREFSFFTFCEREEFTTLDKVGRIIFTVQSGR
ncbi:MAG: hypothetical protein ACYTFY_21865, partial [Planctomycetota bacterium]